MTRYLISFNDGAMTFPEAELPDIARAAHAIVQEAREAGVWVFGGGLEDQQASREQLGGFSIIDVSSREEALAWAAKIAAACRCAQEVRALMPGTDV